MSDDVQETSSAMPVAPPPLPASSPVPMRVLPVDFGGREFMPPPPRRPGIVTALGTSAIVIACLSILASGIAALIGLGMMIGTQASAARATAVASQQQRQQQVSQRMNGFHN